MVKRVPVEPIRTSPGGISPRYAIDTAGWIWDADQSAPTAMHGVAIHSSICPTPWPASAQTRQSLRSVHIEPQPGRLKQIKTTIAHPQGRIRLALEFDSKDCSGTVELPKGIDGYIRLWRT